MAFLLKQSQLVIEIEILLQNSLVLGPQKLKNSFQNSSNN